MVGHFDPYHKWLGIPPSEQPPDHYRLLGLARFEPDAEVIENAADQRMALLKMFSAGPYGLLAERLLNEIAAVRLVLLDPDRKAAYDRKLKLADRQGQQPRSDGRPRTKDRAQDTYALAPADTAIVATATSQSAVSPKEPTAPGQRPRPLYPPPRRKKARRIDHAPVLAIVLVFLAVAAVFLLAWWQIKVWAGGTVEKPAGPSEPPIAVAKAEPQQGNGQPPPAPRATPPGDKPRRASRPVRSTGSSGSGPAEPPTPAPPSPPPGPVIPPRSDQPLTPAKTPTGGGTAASGTGAASRQGRGPATPRLPPIIPPEGIIGASRQGRGPATPGGKPPSSPPAQPPGNQPERPTRPPTGRPPTQETPPPAKPPTPPVPPKPRRGPRLPRNQPPWFGIAKPDFSSLAQQLSQSVVRVTVAVGPTRSFAVGGFAVADGKLIVTSACLFRRVGQAADHLRVEGPDGRPLAARLRNRRDDLDLAFLELQQPLKPLYLARTDQYYLCTPVMALYQDGGPGNLQHYPGHIWDMGRRNSRVVGSHVTNRQATLLAMSAPFRRECGWPIVTPDGLVAGMSVSGRLGRECSIWLSSQEIQQALKAMDGRLVLPKGRMSTHERARCERAHRYISAILRGAQRSGARSGGNRIDQQIGISLEIIRRFFLGGN